MPFLVVDTHTIVWYLTEPDRLSQTAKAALDDAAVSGDLILVPAISLVEITYLVEKRRVPSSAWTELLQRLNDVHSNVRLATLDQPEAEAVQRIPYDLVPDMPDRIIAATALHLNLPLVTRDARIRAAAVKTIW